MSVPVELPPSGFFMKLLSAAHSRMRFDGMSLHICIGETILVEPGFPHPPTPSRKGRGSEKTGFYREASVSGARKFFFVLVYSWIVSVPKCLKM
jgi:hypothetical protein